jgi:DNA-directed RNA polymerase subunit N
MSGELLPIRCITCGKVLADKWSRYEAMIEAGESIENAMNKLGLNRICCRLRMRNPFKYAERVDALDDNLYTAKSKTVSTTGALSAIARNTPMTSIPSNEEIELPPLPDLPQPKQEKKATRTFTAW